jgi:hypothetical protein
MLPDLIQGISGCLLFCGLLATGNASAIQSPFYSHLGTVLWRIVGTTNAFGGVVREGGTNVGMAPYLKLAFDIDCCVSLSRWWRYRIKQGFQNGAQGIKGAIAIQIIGPHYCFKGATEY